MIKHMPSTDVDNLMQRLQVEAQRHRSDYPPASGRGNSSSQTNRIGIAVMPNLAKSPQDVQIPAAIHFVLPDPCGHPNLPAQQPCIDGKCKLRDLLAYQDRAFIYAAYAAVLHRAADDEGIDTYLRVLRDGASKIEVLDFLRRSPEGRKKLPRVSGLSVRLLILRLCRLPVVGGLVRRAVELWRLPETQRSLRATEGNLHSLIEQIETETTQSICTANRALHEISHSFNELTTYATSKAGCDSVNSKASNDDMWRLLDEVHNSLQELHANKASAREVAEIKTSVNAASSVLNSLESSKADLTLVDKTHRHFTEALQTKAGHDEVSELIAFARNDTLQASACLLDSKVDRSSFDELRETLMHSVQIKADRHELTTLTNYFIGLLQARVAKEDIAPLEKAFEALCSRAQSDRAAAGARFEEFGASLQDARNEFGARLETALDDVRKSLTALAQSKADHCALQSVQADIRLRVEKAQGELARTVAMISAGKADRKAFEAAREETRISIERVRENFEEVFGSKADIHALESARTDARLHVDKGLHELNQAVTTISANKADRATLEAAVGENRAAIDAVRREHQTSLQVAIESIREAIAVSARSKADIGVVESVQNETRQRTDNAVGELNHLVTRISANKADRAALETAIAETRVLIDTTRKETQDALHKALAPVTSQTRDVKRNLLEQERRLSLLLDEARKRLPKPISTRQIKTMLTEDDHLLDAMYASFEDIFRGTREDIKHRQSVYLPYVRAINAGVRSAPIVDIGCGRGEWLELLGEAGLEARGVDLNRIFLTRCRELNLDVIERDAVDFLRDQAPNSLGAVTSFHLIEHLPHKILIALMDAALRALRPGGIAIFETPNPRNLQVGSCNFYLDPTHRNPLPPDLMRYLFEARGFVEIDIKELHPCQEGRVTNGAPEVNDTLNRFLFSAQDYAVIGKKS